jgi:sugar lactone lactonase YvrE
MTRKPIAAGKSSFELIKEVTMQLFFLRQTVCYMLLSVVLFVPQVSWAGSMTDQYQLVEQWQTKRDLRVPESVLYDASRNILYISNINGKPTEKNGQGFISRVALNGQIEALKWVTGLNAPKGSALFKNTLYVSDIDHLVAIDIPSGTVTARYPAAGAQFLNDVATDTAGNVYVTDMSEANSVIYMLVQGRMTKWLEGPEISKPNGLHMEPQRLIVGNSGDGTIKAVNLQNKQITAIAKIGRGIDGLRSDGQGNYFVSDWQGRTSFVSATGQVFVLMDTRAEKINAADLEYIQDMRLLLIPTFFDNRVVAYKVHRK